jgi:mannose-1-phosphate guanylyltransferase
MSEIFRDGKTIYNSPNEKNFIKCFQKKMPSILIDYGIMEKAKNVYVLLLNSDGSDLRNLVISLWTGWCKVCRQ